MNMEHAHSAHNQYKYQHTNFTPQRVGQESVILIGESLQGQQSLLV